MAESQATAWDSGNYFPINTWSLISQQLRSRQSYCHHTAASLLLLTKCFRCKGHTARGCLSFNISHSIKPISRLDFPAHPCHWLLIYPTASRTPCTDSPARQPFVFLFLYVNGTWYQSSLHVWIIHRVSPLTKCILTVQTNYSYFWLRQKTGVRKEMVFLRTHVEKKSANYLVDD